MPHFPEGFRYLPSNLDREAQAELLASIRAVVAQAPLFTPVMPKTGQPMTVRMSNCGPLGWVSDQQRGYRYQTTHPVTGRSWPEMPPELFKIWDQVSGVTVRPEACLINHYAPDARMGLHQDRDEQEMTAPVVSISLGDACLFRLGGTKRSDKTASFKLESGDIVVLGGQSRLCFHGVDRIYPNTSTLLAQDGRINLTLRRVTPLP